MYLRLKNKPDLEGFRAIFEEQGKRVLFDRMMEDVEMLDAAYGVGREAYAMGGYLLFFPSEIDFKEAIDKLAEVYHFDPLIYEFDDSIWEDSSVGVNWRRRHYQLSSDDALVMYYPENAKQNERR